MTVSTSTQADRDAYLQHLLTLAQGVQRSKLGVDELREGAIALVHEQSFPSGRDEQWRFTDLSDLLGTRLSLQAEANYGLQSSLPEGVTIAPLSELIRSEHLAQSLVQRLAQIPGGNEVFTALNTAGFADALVVWVRQNQRVELPVELVQSFTKAATLALPRCLVVVEAYASLTLVEQFTGDGSGLNNSVLEIWLEESAELHHVRLQQLGEAAYHVSKTAISQAQNSRYFYTALDLGAKLSRHHLEVYQRGPQTETVLQGLGMVAGDQLTDTHSLIALAHPHGSAKQVQKNIVRDRAHAVFNGKVYVPQAAQMTSAAQLNRNLLLSDKGRVDTKPELDIVADNVKCAHGATVSQLQPEALFYLQSRGVSPSEAQQLLVRGFAMEIISAVPVPDLRDRLSAQLV